jgi:hypothetical protein
MLALGLIVRIARIVRILFLIQLIYSFHGRRILLSRPAWICRVRCRALGRENDAIMVKV